MLVSDVDAQKFRFSTSKRRARKNCFFKRSETDSLDVLSKLVNYVYSKIIYTSSIYNKCIEKINLISE